MKVDLPAPFGPSRPVMPGGTLTVTSFRPITWPYHFETERDCGPVDDRRRGDQVTTSTPRTRRSSTENDSAMRPRTTMSDTCQGVA